MAGYGRQNVVDPVLKDGAATNRLQLSSNIVEHSGNTGFTKNGRCFTHQHRTIAKGLNNKAEIGQHSRMIKQDPCFCCTRFNDFGQQQQLPRNPACFKLN